ncbi:chitin-binding domain-containing protein [Streptomyces sp. ITFR-16]|uniref:chitin-binding domain-containing protein n=1 Tax=Streptomyces sp. ITFR-16 TaxID=3075198 RepID=UPI00288A35F5|nr:chitin-binding domain-containing protein [Streptomyces sp. ITFR-16]WNI26732.1 chitin-binding domain-containing protein [Streptomyces sp. ITFR-16]
MKHAFALGLVLAAVLTPSGALAADAPPRALTGSAAPSCPVTEVDDQVAELLADPEEPAAYYICSNGVPHRFVCPEGTLFSVADQVCDWEWNVQRKNN